MYIIVSMLYMSVSNMYIVVSMLYISVSLMYIGVSLLYISKFFGEMFLRMFQKNALKSSRL